MPGSLKRTAQEQRGRPFRRGESGNPQGRPKGVPNKSSVEVRQIATQLVEDPEFFSRADLLEGRLTRLPVDGGWRGQLLHVLSRYRFFILSTNCSNVTGPSGAVAGTPGASD